jgi:hypothetical protein
MTELGASQKVFVKGEVSRALRFYKWVFIFFVDWLEEVSYFGIKRFADHQYPIQLATRLEDTTYEVANLSVCHERPVEEVTLHVDAKKNVPYLHPQT